MIPIKKSTTRIVLGLITSVAVQTLFVNCGGNASFSTAVSTSNAVPTSEISVPAPELGENCRSYEIPQLSSPPNVIPFFDNFDYAADRNVTDVNSPIFARSAFMAHNWTGVKSIQTDPGRNPRGHLYTESGRLAIESHANGFAGQTDFYLQLGSEDSRNYETVPGKLRIEFDYEISANSHLDRHDKFFYPGRRAYPQTAVYDPTSGEVACSSYLWLLGTSTSSNETDGSIPMELPALGAEHFLFLRSPYADFRNASEYPTNREKLGPNLNANVRITPGAVHHVVFQIDTSTQHGRFEMWIDGIKTHEWIDGVTPNFSWRIPATLVGGHSIMRIPTTLSGGESKSWIDNFRMGTY